MTEDINLRRTMTTLLRPYYYGKLVGDKNMGNMFDALIDKKNGPKASKETWELIKNEYPLEIIPKVVIKVGKNILEEINKEVQETIRENLERQFILGYTCEIGRIAKVSINEFIGFEEIEKRTGHIERNSKGINTEKIKKVLSELKGSNTYTSCHTHVPVGEWVPSPFDAMQYDIGRIEFVASPTRDGLCVTPYRLMDHLSGTNNKREEAEQKEQLKRRLEQQFKWIVLENEKIVKDQKGFLEFDF